MHDQRTVLLRWAMDATVHGNRDRAIQLFKAMLILDPGDQEAIAGLRRLGVAVREAALAVSGNPLLTRLTTPIVAEKPASPPPPPAPRRRRFGFLLFSLAIALAATLSSCGILTMGNPELSASVRSYLSPVAEATALPEPHPQLRPEEEPELVCKTRSREPPGNGGGTGTRPTDSEHGGAGQTKSVSGGASPTDSVSGGAASTAGVGDGPPLSPDAEGRLVLASAIWRYLQETGRLPERLSDLVPKVLDSLPPSPNGVWAYARPDGGGDLWANILGSVQPKLPGSGTPAGPDQAAPPDEAFAPIRVIASKQSRRLEVWAGQTKIRSYPIAIGENDYTPEGTFRIDQRAVLAERLPDGSPNPFGTRWLRLNARGEEGDYGIHGTDRPEQIGQAVTKGCLALAPGAIEDLYSLLPNGTPVTITNS